MKYFYTTLGVLLVFGAILMAENANPQGKEPTMLKAVIHINFEDAERQHSALGNLENILKEDPNAQLEVVCHGPGISLVQNSKGKHGEQVQALMKQGVRFEACENTMRKKDISKEELLAGVSTVRSGAAEVIRRQQQGYSYFRP